MILDRRRIPTILLVAALVSIPALAAAHLHFKLDRSSPAPDTEIESADAIDLWFSQVPQANSTSIRLVDASGELVETPEVEQDAEDGKHQRVAVPEPLDPGSYTVAWRSMAADGHAVRGDFTFTVVPPTRD